MAKKKKKRQHTHKAAATKAEIAEEILALAAIYDADFSLHDDGLGFQLLVVPHPGYHSDNHATVELHVRCVCVPVSKRTTPFSQSAAAICSTHTPTLTCTRLPQVHRWLPSNAATAQAQEPSGPEQ